MKLQGKLKAGVFGMLISAFFLLFSLSPQKADARVGVSISFQTFYDNLSPYGTWFQDPQYGYVWAPRVDRGFRPYYTNGYWVNTDYGNMWMSDYAWGWAAFHYGRWAYSDMYGWIWIPGDEWGPAWVTWRQGDGYYGWAPMRPGISISISFGSGYYVPDPYWTFIPYRNLYEHNFHRYYSPRRTTVIIRNTTIINNTYVNNRNTYVTGPRRSDVERITGRSVRTYQVNNQSREGRSRVTNNNVIVYRPMVERQVVSGQSTPRPREVRPMTEQGSIRNTSSNTNRMISPSQKNTSVRENRPSRVQPVPTTNSGQTRTISRERQVNSASRQQSYSRQPAQYQRNAAWNNNSSNRVPEEAQTPTSNNRNVQYSIREVSERNNNNSYAPNRSSRQQSNYSSERSSVSRQQPDSHSRSQESRAERREARR